MRFLTLLFAVTLGAQEKPSFEKLSWIAGHWTGQMGRAVIAAVSEPMKLLPG
jgi:hypothetical protein